MSLDIASAAGSRSLLLIFIILVFSANRVSGYGLMPKERTLAIVKPDGVSGNYTDKIKNEISAFGFSIVKEMTAELDEDTAKKFYAEHSSKSFFPSLIKYITSGPMFIMVLEKDNAVEDWRKLIGPTDAQKARVTHPSSIRAMCGVDNEKNCVHGSDSTQSASREIELFFGILADDFEEKHDEL